MNIAIIPARSGSKRIRDKNIYPFAGKPLLAWSIEHALESGLFDYVYVSTDSERYADVARQYGAWIPFLRDSCADDFSGVAQVAVHELCRIEKHLGEVCDTLAVLQPTCPLCSAKTIGRVYDAFIAMDAQMMSTCFPYAYGNPWWAFKLTDSAEPDFVLSSPEKSRSQDCCQLYCPTGAICFAKAQEFKQNPTGYGNGKKLFPIAWEEGFDIDDPQDLMMGELLLKARQGGDVRDAGGAHPGH